MCISAHGYVYIYIYIHTYIHTHGHTYTHVPYMCTHGYIYTHVHDIHMYMDIHPHLMYTHVPYISWDTSAGYTNLTIFYACLCTCYICAWLYMDTHKTRVYGYTYTHASYMYTGTLHILRYISWIHKFTIFMHIYAYITHGYT